MESKRLRTTDLIWYWLLEEWVAKRYSLAVLITLRPSVLVLLSLLLRLRFMLLVALVRDMLGALRTNDSIKLASREDKLGTLALELMGAPAAKRELTESRALLTEHKGLWDAASLLDDSETELTSGELTLTIPIEMAVDSADCLEVPSGAGVLRSPLSLPVSAVSVLVLEAEPPSAVESTTIGSWPSAPGGPPTMPSPCSNRLSTLRSTRVELRLISLLLATLHTELLLPLRLEELAPAVEDEPPLSGQLFFTRLLQDCGVPATVDETGLGDGADSGSYPGASLRSNFPSAPIRYEFEPPASQVTSIQPGKWGRGDMNG